MMMTMMMTIIVHQFQIALTPGIKNSNKNSKRNKNSKNSQQNSNNNSSSSSSSSSNNNNNSDNFHQNLLIFHPNKNNQVNILP